MPVVREAEKRVIANESLNHEYLPVLGFEPFCTAATGNGTMTYPMGMSPQNLDILVHSRLKKS